MTTRANELPQLSGGLFLTDACIETDLIVTEMGRSVRHGH